MISRFVYEDFITFDDILDSKCLHMTRGSHSDYDFQNGGCTQADCPIEYCKNVYTGKESYYPMIKRNDGICVTKTSDIQMCSPKLESDEQSPPPQVYQQPSPQVYQQPSPQVYQQPQTQISPNVIELTGVNIISLLPTVSTPMLLQEKECNDDEYYNEVEFRCKTCGRNYQLTNSKAKTFQDACTKLREDCSKYKVLCCDDDCNKIVKTKVPSSTNEFECTLPVDCNNCNETCAQREPPKREFCPANPRTMCLNPEDLSFEYYKHNNLNDCALENRTKTKTIDACITSCPTIGQRKRRRGRKILCCPNCMIDGNNTCCSNLTKVGEQYMCGEKVCEA